MNSDSLPIAQVESDLSPGLCSVFAKVKRQSVKNNKNKSLRWEVDKSELYNDFKEKVNLHKHEGKEQIENCWMKRQLVMPVINYLRSWRNRMQCQKKKQKTRRMDAEKTATREGSFSTRPRNQCLHLKLLKDKGSLLLTLTTLLAHAETCAVLSFWKLQNFQGSSQGHWLGNRNQKLE